MSKMYSYLVSTSRFEVYLRKGVLTVCIETFIVGNGSLSVLAHTAQDYRLSLPCNRRVYRTAFGDSAVYCRIVDLFAVPLQELCRKSVLGNYAKPRGIAVKPVHRAESQLGIAVGKVISECIPLMPYGRVYRHTAGLIEHHKAVILKGYGHIEAAVWFKEAVVLQAEDYPVPCRDRINAPDSNAVPSYAALLTFKLCQQTL